MVETNITPAMIASSTVGTGRDESGYVGNCPRVEICSQSNCSAPNGNYRACILNTSNFDVEAIN